MKLHFAVLSMLPFDSRHYSPTPYAASASPAVGSSAPLPEFMRRLCDFRQMDFESAADQILDLLSLEPQRVYVLVL